MDSSVGIYTKIYPNTTKSFKDIYKIFIEAGLLKLVRNGGGLLCYIVPNTLLLQPRYKDARTFLLNHRIVEILNLGEDVFDGVVVPTCVIFVQHKQIENNTVKFADLSIRSKFAGSMNSIKHVVNLQATYANAPGLIFVKEIRKTKDDELTLSEILDMKDAGINYQRVNVGLAEKGNSDLGNRLFYDGKQQSGSDCEYWKGADIDSYYIAKKTGRYVKTRIKLRDNERVILNRDYFSIVPKIIWRQTASYPIAVIDKKGVWFGRSIQAGIINCAMIKQFRYEYLLGLLNSKYIRHLYIQTVKESGRVFPQVKLDKMKNLPIKKIEINDQGPICKAVDKIMQITNCKDYSDENTKHNIKEYAREIDQMVYKLYGLTEEEVEIVESSAR